MSNLNYSTTVEAGRQVVIPSPVLLSLNATEGDYIDFDFINGVWQISCRHRVSEDFFPAAMEKILSERLRRSISEERYVEFKNASDIPGDKRAAHAKAARGQTE